MHGGHSHGLYKILPTRRRDDVGGWWWPWPRGVSSRRARRFTYIVRGQLTQLEVDLRGARRRLLDRREQQSDSHIHILQSVKLSKGQAAIV